MSGLVQGGKVWEKAGVGVSVVYGTMPPEAYRAAKGNNHNSKPTTNGVRPCLCTCLGEPWNIQDEVRLAAQPFPRLCRAPRALIAAELAILARARLAWCMSGEHTALFIVG